MGNELTPYAKVDNPLAFVESMAKPFAALIGCSVDQGAAVALTCLCEGITPLDCQRKYHFIQGKPAMKADAMLADFRTVHGGSHRVIDRTPEIASIELTNSDGEKYEANLTWEEIQQSRWPWRDHADHEKGLKDNWSTPTDRRAMLWARLISDSIRAFCPEIVSGVYTPEEMLDFVDVKHTVTEVRTTAKEAMEANIAREDDATKDTAPKEDVVDVPFKPVDDSDKVLGKGFATKVQIAKIKGLYSTLGIPFDRQQAALDKRDCEHLRNLKRKDAQEILDKLESVERQKDIAGN